MHMNAQVTVNFCVLNHLVPDMKIKVAAVFSFVSKMHAADFMIIKINILVQPF